MKAYTPAPTFVRIPTVQAGESTQMETNQDMNIFNENGVLKRHYRGTTTTFGSENPFDQDLNTYDTVEFATVKTYLIQTGNNAHLIPDDYADDFVTTSATQSISSKTLVTPIIATIKSSATYSHALPDVANDAVATTDASQTLISKTIRTESNTITPLTGQLRKTTVQTIPDSTYTHITSWFSGADTTIGGTAIADTANGRLRLMKAGTWIFNVTCSFAASATGYRRAKIMFDLNGGGPGAVFNMFGGEVIADGSSAYRTVMNFSCHYYTSDTDSNAYLFMWQDSGGNLDAGSSQVENQIIFRATYLCATSL